MKRLVYADNAAITKLDINAFEVMKPQVILRGDFRVIIASVIEYHSILNVCVSVEKI